MHKIKTCAGANTSCCIGVFEGQRTLLRWYNTIRESRRPGKETPEGREFPLEGGLSGIFNALPRRGSAIILLNLKIIYSL